MDRTICVNGQGLQQVGTKSFSDLQKLLDQKAQALSESFLYDCIGRNELGCAELLHRVAKGEIVYCRASEQWYWWNGLHWQEDKGGNIYSLTGDVLSSVYRKTAAKKYQELLAFEAANGSDPFKITNEQKDKIAQLKKAVKSAQEQAKALYKLQYIRNVLVFAGATELLGLIGDEWDTQIHLLGVKNAVIDLTSGLPVKPEPTQYIRTVAPVNYDSNATCPTWVKAISEIFAHDMETVGYIQRFLGYALSGACHETSFPVWYGKHGQNGKEFILERIRSVLGGRLTGAVDPELLLQSKNDKGKNGATEALMALQGRRIAWASETNEGRRFDLAAMKDLSGGHILTGRHNYGHQVEWKRTHTLILLTNHLPHVNGGGGGAEWERIRLLPFTESFVSDPNPNEPHQHKKDPTLGERIDRDELPGVLNWLIAGCLEWRRNGLQTPVVVKAATAEYRKAEDTLGRFIDECCVVVTAAKVGASELYQSYRSWCAENGDSAMGSKTFGGKLEDRGYERHRENKGVMFNGIGLAVKRVYFDNVV